jgi:hypothetical protein
MLVGYSVAHRQTVAQIPQKHAMDGSARTPPMLHQSCERAAITGIGCHQSTQKFKKQNHDKVVCFVNNNMHQNPTKMKMLHCYDHSFQLQKKYTWA